MERESEVTSPNIAVLPSGKLPDLGLLNPLLHDLDVTEIMVNDLRNISIEKQGKLIVTPIHFKGIDELNRVVRALLEPAGKTLTPEIPFASVSLPDGSRVHVIGPPLTAVGPCITIRRFPRRYTLKQLAQAGTMDVSAHNYLVNCILQKKSMLISGGTGSGKTTLLNALSTLISPNERVVAIEDSAELQLSQPNHVKLMTKPRSPSMSGVTLRELVIEALRMRPDRIIVGECRGVEALDLLQAMATGHAGSMTTLHARHSREALHRLETLVMLAGADLPISAVRRQIGSAIDVVVQTERDAQGVRRIISIEEITAVEIETFVLHSVFKWDSTKNAYDYFPSAKGIPK